MALNIDAKFEVKLAFAVENDMRNLANFHQSTQKSQNWDFDGIVLFKVENVYISLKLTEELCVMTVKNVPEFEKELTYQFKTDMRNLMNFDLNTQKHNLYKVTNLPFQNHPPHY